MPISDGKGRKNNAVREETNPFIEHTSGYESVGASQREEREMQKEAMIAIESALSPSESESATRTTLLGESSTLSIRSGLRTLFQKMTLKRSPSKSVKRKSKPTRKKRRG